MRIETAATAANLVLVVSAIVVAARVPAHRPLAAWLLGSNAVSALSRWAVNPYLARLPRPYVGFPRVVLHASQALLLVLGSLFVSVAWHACGARRRLAWPVAVAAVATFALVVGYQFSPGAGLYRVGPVVFRSNAVYLAAAWACAAASVTAIALAARRSATDEQVRERGPTFAAVASLVGIDVVRLVFPFAHPIVNPSARPVIVSAVYLMGYTAALGAHVAWLMAANRRGFTVAPSVLAESASNTAPGDHPTGYSHHDTASAVSPEAANVVTMSNPRSKAEPPKPSEPSRPASSASAAARSTVPQKLDAVAWDELRRRYPVTAAWVDRVPREALQGLARSVPRDRDEAERLERLFAAVEGLPQEQAVSLAVFFTRLLMEVDVPPGGDKGSSGSNGSGSGVA